MKGGAATFSTAERLQAVHELGIVLCYKTLTHQTVKIKNTENVHFVHVV